MSSRIDTYAVALTGKELLRRLRKRGCRVVRQESSHVIVRCGRCQSTVPVHAGEDLTPGVLSRIRRDLAPCIGTEVFR